MPDESFVQNILSGGAQRRATLLGLLGNLIQGGQGENPEEASKNLSDLGGLFKIAGQEQKILSKSLLPKRMFEMFSRQQMQQQQGTPGMPEELDAVKQFLRTMQ